MAKMRATNETTPHRRGIEWHTLSSVPHDDDGDSDGTLTGSHDDHSDSDSGFSKELKEKDISPMGARDMSSLMQTVTTMQICYELFKSWDKVLREPSTTRTAAIEEVHDSIKRLLNESLKALGAAKKMLDGHCRYSRALCKALGKSSSTGRFQITREMETQAETIQQNARTYGDTVALIKDLLQGLTNQIERAQRQAQKKSWWQKLLGWVTGLIRVLATIFMARLAALAVRQVAGLFAGSFFGAAMGPNTSLVGGETIKEQSETLLQFLKYRLRNGVSEACDRLASLDNCYTIMTNIMYESGEETFTIDGRMAKRMKWAWNRQYVKLNEFRVRVATDGANIA